MTLPEAKSAPGSPKRKAYFARGNTVVHASPRSTGPRIRASQSGQKFRAAQQQARKPSNPIRASNMEAEGWQDIENVAEKPNPNGLLSSRPDLRPARPVSPVRVPELTNSPQLEPAKLPVLVPNPEDNSQFGLNSDDSENPDLSISPVRSFRRNPERWPSDEESNASMSLSFLNFSPRHASANFLRRIRRRSPRTSPRSYRRLPNSSESDSTFPSMYEPPTHHSYSLHRGSPRRTPVRPNLEYENYSLGHQFPVSPSVAPEKQGVRPPLWMDPALPGQLALYLQVLFNLAMVLVVLAAIAMFYTTIRNDINLKIDEYTADIIDEITRAKDDYIANNCGSDTRAPFMEDACKKWERAMSRDPNEVGRTIVGAEMLGTIIEAFVRPIGLKSIMMLTILFVGSFLLINLVFSSRIGPRFSAGSAVHH